MASSTTTINETDLASFHEALRGSKRIMAMLGAGLSASSGLPTFRGAGGLWRTHDAMSLADIDAFEDDPGLVWQFYNHRRHMALSVEPNPAHYALAKLARRMPGFVAVSQNVDGLCQRADHPKEQLHLLHGTLFELQCADKERCKYKEPHFIDPVCEALAQPTAAGAPSDPTSNDARAAAAEAAANLDISDPSVALPSIPTSALPKCPKCKKELLRPGVIWFGERLPEDVIESVENYIKDPEPIDMIIVIGTSSKVYPAAGYVAKARQKGNTRLCVVNMDKNDVPMGGWRKGDWMFQGDAAVIVPKLFEPIIGQL